MMFKRDPKTYQRGIPQPMATNRIGLKIGLVVLWVAFLGVSGYALFLSGLLSINKIEVTGVKTLRSGNITQFIGETLQGAYMGFVPKNNLVLISGSQIANAITGKFRIAASAVVTKHFPDKLEIVIVERQGVVVWCSGEQCAFIDEQGYAYESADSATVQADNSELLIVRDEGQRPIELGQYVVDPEYLVFVISLREALQKKNGFITERIYRTPSAVSGEVRVRTLDGWEIYVDQARGVEGSTQVLKLFLESSFKDRNRNDLEYIDIRTENKVYYKFKNVAASVDSQSQ